MAGGNFSPYTAEEDIVTSMPVKMVVPYEFNDDVRNLPYYPYMSYPASKSRIDRFSRRPAPGLRFPMSLSPAPFRALVLVLPDASDSPELPRYEHDRQPFRRTVAQPASPDTNGDVGPNHYIQAVNGSYAIYDKQELAWRR